MQRSIGREAQAGLRYAPHINSQTRSTDEVSVGRPGFEEMLHVMTTITDLMVADHHRIDRLYSETEALVSDSNWGDAEIRFQQFMDAVAHHFLMEEQVLFPAFEERAGQSKGPTQSMRMEHNQIRDYLSKLSQAMAHHKREDYLSTAATLREFRQQHNVKEEQMLYRMADLSLALDAENIIQRMQSV